MEESNSQVDQILESKLNVVFESELATKLTKEIAGIYKSVSDNDSNQIANSVESGVQDELAATDNNEKTGEHGVEENISNFADDSNFENTKQGVGQDMEKGNTASLGSMDDFSNNSPDTEDAADDKNTGDFDKSNDAFTEDKEGISADIQKEKEDIGAEIQKEKDIREKMLADADARNKAEKAAIEGSVQDSKDRDLREGWHGSGQDDVNPDSRSSEEKEHLRELNKERVLGARREKLDSAGVKPERKDNATKKSENEEVSGSGKEEARNLKSGQKNDKGNTKKASFSEKVKKRTDAAFAAIRKSTAELLKAAWAGTPETVGLAFLYVMFHGIVKYLIKADIINDLFCKFSEEWIPDPEDQMGGMSNVSKEGSGGIKAKAKEELKKFRAFPETVEKVVVLALVAIIAAILFMLLVFFVIAALGLRQQGEIILELMEIKIF